MSEEKPVGLVYKVTDGGEPTPVEVEYGKSDGLVTEIVSGLNEGDTIIKNVSSMGRGGRNSTRVATAQGDSGRKMRRFFGRMARRK